MRWRSRARLSNTTAAGKSAPTSCSVSRSCGGGLDIGSGSEITHFQRDSDMDSVFPPHGSRLGCNSLPAGRSNRLVLQVTPRHRHGTLPVRLLLLSHAVDRCASSSAHPCHEARRSDPTVLHTTARPPHPRRACAVQSDIDEASLVRTIPRRSDRCLQAVGSSHGSARGAGRASKGVGEQASVASTCDGLTPRASARIRPSRSRSPSRQENLAAEVRHKPAQASGALLAHLLPMFPHVCV